MFMLNKQSGMVLAIAAFALLLGSTANAADPLKQSLKIEKNMINAAGQSQVRINKLSDAARDMSGDYKLTMQQVDNLRSYNKQYEELIKSQEADMASIKNQMNHIDDTEKGVVPLMNDMIDTLEQFVALDIPFLPAERHKRIKRLRTNMLRADLTNSEKYRQILEAYSIEIQYGETIEAYKGPIKTQDGNILEVSYLRFGRVALVYQSPDEQTAAYWDVSSRSWKPLDDSYRIPVRKAIKIARGQSNPDLVELPVAAAQPAAAE